MQTIVSRRLSITDTFNLSGNCAALVRRKLVDNDIDDNELVGFISAECERLYSDGANRVIRHKLIRSLLLSDITLGIVAIRCFN